MHMQCNMTCYIYTIPHSTLYLILHYTLYYTCHIYTILYTIPYTILHTSLHCALYTMHYIIHYIYTTPHTTHYTGKSLAKVVLGPTLHEQLVLHSTHYEQNKRRWDISKIKANSSNKSNEYGVTVVPIRRRLSHTTTNTNNSSIVTSTTADASYTISNITATYTYYMPTDADFYNTEYMINLLQQVHSATLSTTTNNHTHTHSALLHIYNFTMPIYNSEQRDASILESDSSLETYDEKRLIDHNRRLIDHDNRRLIDSTTTSNSGSIEIMPRLEHNFALTQSLRCTGKNAVDASIAWRKGGEWVGQNYDLYMSTC